MRTTVTLDPDVEALIKKSMKERGLSFKEAVNGAVRAGLIRRKPAAKKFVQKTFPLGGEQLFRWDKALATADAIDDEELTRRLSVHK